MEGIRIDKFLWAVRLCRTRSAAAEACRKNWVKVGDCVVKASRILQAREVFSLKRDGLWMTYRVVEALEKRVGAKLVETYLEDLTPPEVREEAKERRERARTHRGEGRPTRKEREAIKKLFADND